MYSNYYILVANDRANLEDIEVGCNADLCIANQDVFTQSEMSG